MISSIGGIRALFLLLEQAVSRRDPLYNADASVANEFDFQFTSNSRAYVTSAATALCCVMREWGLTDK